MGLSPDVRSWSEPGLKETSSGLGNVDMSYLNSGSSFSLLDICRRRLTVCRLQQAEPWCCVGDV